MMVRSAICQGMPRQVDDARVREELGEEAPHGLGRRRIRRAEIDDEDAGRSRAWRHDTRSPGAGYEGARTQKKRPGVTLPAALGRRGDYQVRRTPANITFASSPLR